MHACFCMLVVVSVFIFMSSATDFIGFDVLDSIVVHPTRQEEQTTPKGDEGLRRKRWISSTDSTNIIKKINRLRGSVGASNMNFLTYNVLLELDVSNWTLQCDYDSILYTTLSIFRTEETFAIKYASRDPPDHISLLEEIFTDPKFYNPVRSVYLRDVGAGTTQCFGARVKGQDYFMIYITAYAFSFTSDFNKNRTQFTLGKECTACLSGSYWCDGGLCRDDCSGQISTCSCYTSCPKCRDWNRPSCKCPSQRFADAVTLNCSKRETGEGGTPIGGLRSGGTPYKAASWALIIVSTLAFIHLQ